MTATLSMRHARCRAVLTGAAAAALWTAMVAMPSSAAHAQEATTPSAPSLVEPPASEDKRDKEARALYEAGVIAFDAGRFRNALEAFQSAYELSQRPALLYNVGSAADRLRLDAVALDAFERYIIAEPHSEHASSVQARIEVLREAVARQRAQQAAAAEAAAAMAPVQEPLASATPAATNAPEASKASEPAMWPRWTVIGAGAGLLAGGIVTLGIGQRNRNKIEDAAPGTAFSDVSRYDNADVLTGVGIALAAVGAAGVALGTVWLVGRPGSDHQVSLQIAPTGMSLRGSL